MLSALLVASLTLTPALPGVTDSVASQPITLKAVDNTPPPLPRYSAQACSGI